MLSTQAAALASVSQDVAQIIDALPALVGYVDTSLHLRFLNKAFADWFGSPLEELKDRHIAQVLGEEDFACARPYMENALSGLPQKYERTLYLTSVTGRHVIAIYVPHAGPDGKVLGFFALVNDISELTESRNELQKHRALLEETVAERTRVLSETNSKLQEEIAMRRYAEQLADAEKKTMEMICAGANLHAVLESLCESFERFSEGGFCSILVADEDAQLLLRSISPSLPDAFVNAIKEIPIAADTGCSGSAAFLKQHVYAEDIATDPRWERYREVALANDIRSSWSEPIVSASGRVLGTFAIYYRTPKQPPPADKTLVERAANLATIAFERDQAEKRLNYLATHDPLTHLPNRHLLQINLGKAISRATRSGSIFALMFIDLDRFKQINDELGHEYGDELLKQVAKRLTGAVRNGDTICRLGGDEFTAIIENIGKPGDAEDIAAKLTAVLSRRFDVHGKELHISCSIGVVLCPEHGIESQSLLRKADAAMYHAKNLGRNNYQLHMPFMDGGIQDATNMQEDLFKALELNQFVIEYQPQYDAQANRVLSVEALLRWNHPTRGLLMPPQFVPLAEDSGLIVPIGQWVLREVCLQNRMWHKAGFSLRVAVNVSARQVRQPDFASYVRRVLEEVDMPAQFLELELSESIVSRYEQVGFDNLAQLKKSGVYITVDDFGTGYSSLSYLRRLPVDGLKIDKTFTQDAPDDEAAASMIDALLALAKGLNLSVTAQGVERLDQLAFLAEHGCCQLQGYAISEPLSADGVQRMLEEVKSCARRKELDS